MTGWVCPRCGRGFGRTNQWHSCVVPAGSEQALAGRPAEQRAIHDTVLAHLRDLGPIRVEPVRATIMIKRVRTFAELKLGRDHVELAFLLSREIDSPRILRKLRLSANRVAHVVRLDRNADVDDEVRTWLTEAWESSPR